ncbi:hypothetical protein C0993_005388, partial [Termitomyces sp. T159_Od127]
MWPAAVSVTQSMQVIAQALEAPLAKVLLEQRDKEMGEVPLQQDETEVLEAGVMKGLSVSKAAGPLNWGLAASAHAPEVLKPQKTHWGHKLPLNMTKIEVVDFLANVSVWAKPVQLLFINVVVVLALPAQFEVIKLATDLHIPIQYNRLVNKVAKTVATSKGKQTVVLTEEDKSDFEQLLLEAEEEEEEGIMPAEYFQHIQQNKKLAKKKVNKAQTVATLTQKVQNNFFRQISD